MGNDNRICNHVLRWLAPDDTGPVRQHSKLHHVLQLARKRLDDLDEHTVLSDAIQIISEEWLVEIGYMNYEFVRDFGGL